ncbi:MAG TPA: PQQ-binding-like beta-propeller repeat protein, partial [Methylomirabilota bacterium]|nr:PQQ-binding-like beta-propeller repeat protein [Methylomirabilota bacterium]
MKLNLRILPTHFGVVLSMVCLLLFGAQAATNPVNLLWTQYYNNTNTNFFGANHSDNSRAMALDESGNVIVTGWSGSPPHFCTVKYAARSGALLWEKRYQNPTNSAYPGAVAVDRHGNVIVTGSSGADFYTVKYAAADGALLWEKSYNGPENLGDSGRALAVDTDGNVIVAATIDFDANEIGDVEHARSYIAKYAAADGALMWEAFGPTNELNVPRAVAVDSSGDVIVTGGFGLIDVYMDLMTVKYAGTNGM